MKIAFFFFFPSLFSFIFFFSFFFPPPQTVVHRGPARTRAHGTTPVSCGGSAPGARVGPSAVPAAPGTPRPRPPTATDLRRGGRGAAPSRPSRRTPADRCRGDPVPRRQTLPAWGRLTPGAPRGPHGRPQPPARCDAARVKHPLHHLLALELLPTPLPCFSCRLFSF